MTEEAPSARRCVVCADDFGCYSGTSETILGLMERGFVNAASCLVEGEAWPAQSAPLRRLGAAASHVSIGLHLNLTESIGRQTQVLSPARLAFDRSSGFVQRIFDRFQNQWNLFVDAMGAPPDFVDGHQHVHLAFASRAALFRLLEQTRFAGWVRQCRTSSSRLSAKRLVLDPLSDALRRQASRRNLKTNPGFGGLRQFREQENLAELWIRDLAAMRDGGVLMVHPGVAMPGDPIGACREQEAREIPLIAEVVAEHGLTMLSDARAMW